MPLRSSPSEKKLNTDLGVQLAFELAWTLLGFRRYEECAETFLELMKMNNWWVDYVRLWPV